MHSYCEPFGFNDNIELSDDFFNLYRLNNSQFRILIDINKLLHKDLRKL